MIQVIHAKATMAVRSRHGWNWLQKCKFGQIDWIKVSEPTLSKVEEDGSIR